MLKSVLGFCVLALMMLSGVNLSSSLRQGFAFGSLASWRDVPAEEPLKLELHYDLSDNVLSDSVLSNKQLLHLTAEVSMNGADLPCENVVWYTIRKDAFYLNLEPDLRGCSGEVVLPEGEWDIRAVFIKDNFSAEETLSLTIPK
jgi:hypothetical protein